ncbi:hypothetical protein SDJN02_18320, partial [Cucurbita argyrosperma subsp. argyrosperma]
MRKYGLVDYTSHKALGFQHYFHIPATDEITPFHHQAPKLKEKWNDFGQSAPNLQEFAMRILGLTCSDANIIGEFFLAKEFQYKRLQLHNKQRNRLAESCLNELVFIKYNRALKRRYKIREVIDPISSKDIVDSTRRINDDSEDRDDLASDDDSLTSGNVSRETGPKELIYYLELILQEPRLKLHSVHPIVVGFKA